MPFISSRVSHQECVAQGSSGTSFNASRSRLLKKRRRDTLVFVLTPLLGHSFSPSVLFFPTFFLRLLSLFPFLAFSHFYFRSLSNFFTPYSLFSYSLFSSSFLPFHHIFIPLLVFPFSLSGSLHSSFRAVSLLRSLPPYPSVSSLLVSLFLSPSFPLEETKK